jgi:hypothetical protein
VNRKLRLKICFSNFQSAWEFLTAQPTVYYRRRKGLAAEINGVEGDPDKRGKIFSPWPMASSN